jgi:hypothetical protein
VLREIGNKVKKLEKLGTVDVLDEVHEAAEDLQRKVDQKSYLLVNSESWEIGNRHELVEPQDFLNLDEDENKILQHKSLSEAILDLRSVTVPKSWDGRIPTCIDSTPPASVPPENKFIKQVSWPRRISFNADAVPVVEESKTYENASALALATFTSLLIEFVARLQNLVDSFEELSIKANFKDPDEQPAAVGADGFWNRLRNWLKF